MAEAIGGVAIGVHSSKEGINREKNPSPVGMIFPYSGIIPLFQHTFLNI